MNRKQRRMEQRQRELEQALDSFNEDMRQFMPDEYFKKKCDAIDKIQRNGITLEDLKQNYDIGFKEGFKAAGEPIVKGCFAAICLVLHEMHGFGRKRCCDVLNAVDQHMMYTLTSDEAIQEVWDKIGLHLDFKEAFDRVQEKN